MAIKVLDKHIAELIAAGEAIERPASAIKELIENSIDAGATKIVVEIRNGGSSYMRITDNGCGILHDEVPLAFLRHATSKVENQDDLSQISTLGFRGEALASLCAVAKVQMITSVDGEQGTEYVIEGGEQKNYCETGCPKGTTIIVRDLFYNTPARMKFLKTDMGEGNAVAAIIDRIALSHPEIAFKFIRDSKQMLSTPGMGDLSGAAYATYGGDFVKDSINVDYSVNGIRVHGLTSKPAASRKSRAMQHFYINGRYIRSGTISKAVENAYKNSIMVGRFASCVLFVDIPFNAVDINVHPAKLECRFTDDRPVFEAVYFAVKSALEKGDTRGEVKLKPAVSVTIPPIQKGEQIGLHNVNITTPQPQIIKQYLKNIKHDVKPEIKRDTSFVVHEDSVPVLKKKPTNILDIILDESEPEKIVETPKTLETSKIQVKNEQQNELPEVDIKLVGEVFKTYIICESDQDIIIIDKHAAHERMIYENIKSRKYNSAQMLMPAQSVTLTKEECDALVSNCDKLVDLGFEIEYFGSSNVLVRSVPMVLSECNIADLVQEIAAGFLENADKVEIEHLEWLYENMACRAAVKGGDSNGEDLMIIAKRVAQFDDIRYCPHGRAVAYKLTKKELDKQFGRLG